MLSVFVPSEEAFRAALDDALTPNHRQSSEPIETDRDRCVATVEELMALLRLFKRQHRDGDLGDCEIGQASDHLAKLLCAAVDVSSVEDPWEALMLEAGVVTAAGAVTKASLRGELETNNGEDDEEEDVPDFTALAAKLLGNVSSKTTRSAAEACFRFEVPHGPESASSHAQKPLELLIAGLDYAVVETAGFVWPCSLAASSAIFLASSRLAAEQRDAGVPSAEPSSTSAPFRSVEVGAGTAIPSLVLAASLVDRGVDNAHHDVSDINTAVVENIRKIAERNHLAAALRPKVLNLSELDAITAPKGEQYDVVLGADVIYDFTFTEIIAKALPPLLKAPAAGKTAVTKPEKMEDAAFLNAVIESVVMRRWHPEVSSFGGVALFVCLAYRDGVTTFPGCCTENKLAIVARASICSVLPDAVMATLPEVMRAHGVVLAVTHQGNE